MPLPDWQQVEQRITSSGLNLFTSLAEIGDIPDTLAQARGLLDKLPTSRKDVASAHLGYVFGVKPIISDLQGIAKAIANQDDHWRRLHDGNKETIRWKSNDVLTFDDIPYFTGIPQDEFRIRGETKISRTITVVASWKPPTNFIRPFLDYFGLQPDASDIWALVPLSFVVDWFAGVGDALSKLDTTGISQSLEINSVYSSVKAEGTYEFIGEKRSHLWESSSSDGQVMCTVDWSTYNRQLVTLPFRSSVDLNGSGLNAGKQLSLGSLGQTIFGDRVDDYVRHNVKVRGASVYSRKPKLRKP